MDDGFFCCKANMKRRRRKNHWNQPTKKNHTLDDRHKKITHLCSLACKRWTKHTEIAKVNVLQPAFLYLLLIVVVVGVLSIQSHTSLSLSRSYAPAYIYNIGCINFYSFFKRIFIDLFLALSVGCISSFLSWFFFIIFPLMNRFIHSVCHFRSPYSHSLFAILVAHIFGSYLKPLINFVN